ncbi:MAG: 50S ribosomal protein L6, partial [Candidatus Saccharimonadales bacterium]
MSRVGKSPIVLPSDVRATIEPNLVTVEGTKGKLSQSTLPGVKVSQSENVITVARSS